MESPFTEDYEKDRELKPQPRGSWARELIDAIEVMSIENIKDYQLEMGFYIGLKERTKNNVTAAYIDLVITMTRYIIEENHEDVEKYRRWKKELCGL